MIKIDIPGRESLTIEHVVLDYNGTIARDGELIEGVPERIEALSRCVKVHILTADTYGTVREKCAGLGAEIDTFPGAGAAACKERIVRSLGEHVVCLGNGYNDKEMFGAAALSVAILESEGCCASLISCADVLVRSIADGLDLLLKPDRLRATLRT